MKVCIINYYFTDYKASVPNAIMHYSEDEKNDHKAD